MTLVLRPYRQDDLPLETSSDSEYDDFGPRTPLTSPPGPRLEDAGHLAIDVDGTVIGDVGWFWTAYGPGPSSRCPNIGITILDAGHRGQGHGTEAQRQLVDVLFRGTVTNRIEASTDVTNLAEQRSLQKAGFTREGVLRGAQWRRGEFHDLVSYSILRADWAAG